MATSHQLLLSLLDLLNTHKPDHLQAVFAPHFRGQDCAHTGPILGPDGVWAVVQEYLHAFPDLALQLVDVQIGDQGVTAYWTARGTHQGQWMNIPATGREVTVQGMWMLHIEKGRITRARALWDVAGLLRAIGLLPDL
jgi:steroid delta-isomerase-like uncharacterized protein